jgi:hypothetical protein
MARWSGSSVSSQADASVDVSPKAFRPGATQRIHDADARALLSGAIILVFLIVFAAELYGCYGLRFCKDVHEVRDAIDPFAGAAYTALGAAVAFYFADRSGK